jgi:hypothetical protein
MDSLAPGHITFRFIKKSEAYVNASNKQYTAPNDLKANVGDRLWAEPADDRASAGFVRVERITASPMGKPFKGKLFEWEV